MIPATFCELATSIQQSQRIEASIIWLVFLKLPVTQSQL
jgi:hypothetical protein